MDYELKKRLENEKKITDVLRQYIEDGEERPLAVRDGKLVILKRQAEDWRSHYDGR